MPQPSERADRNRGQKDESNPRDDPQAKATNRLADFVTPTAKHHQAREQHSPNVQFALHHLPMPATFSTSRPPVPTPEVPLCWGSPPHEPPVPTPEVPLCWGSPSHRARAASGPRSGGGAARGRRLP
eukprot:423848-Pyramimonas_sp.AAC.1